MKGSFVVVMVAALLLAAILPTAITTLSATPTRTFLHTEVADEDPADEVIGPVAQLPVIVNTSTVTIDDVNCALTTCYTVVIATGVYTIVTADIADGQTVDIRYQSIQDFTGIIGLVYDNLPVFLVIGALLLVMGWFGIKVGSGKGGMGGI